MNTKISILTQTALMLSAMGLLVAATASAQESAYQDLNACTKGEQIKSTAKGAIAGAFTGLGAAFLTGKKDDAGKAALIGAAAGGAIGFATAYYSAIDTCYKMNPTWVPESKLVRDPSTSYAQVNKENNYKPKDGVKVIIKQVEMASYAKPGSKVDINSTFDVMTPDGAETPVMIDRKLFAIDGGKETIVPFPGNNASNGRANVVQPGRNTDFEKLPIATDAKPGSTYRVEISVAAAGKDPQMMSRTVTVQ